MCDENVNFSTIATRVLKYEEFKEDSAQLAEHRPKILVI